MGAPLFTRRVEAPCTLEIEVSADSVHAHVVLDGVEVGPGDRVTVHDAPVRIGWGERVSCRRRATVVRAGLLQRMWTRLSARLELTELYEVSFSPGPAAPARGSRP